MGPPYAAELRVYEPLAAFPAAERRRWQTYLAGGAVLTSQQGPAWERWVGLRAACRPTPVVPPPGSVEEHAYVVATDAVPLVCPLRTALRCWAAASELPVLLPAELAGLVLSPAELSLAQRAHERWVTDHAELRAHVLTSRWAVPVRWFLLFHRDERRLELAPPVQDQPSMPAAPASASEPAASATRQPRPREGSSDLASDADGAASAGGRSLVYRAPMGQARRRVARGLAVLRRAFGTGPVVVSVESLGRWLEEFHPRSMVELDYGGLVNLRSDDELRADESAADVAIALAALASGDAQIATDAYDRVIERWRIAHRVESAN